MKECKKCLLTEAYPGLSFNEEGICLMCASNQVFSPYGEDKLIRILETAKKRKRGEYDALVPLSGGKDSMYILYLAVKEYKLKVLTMTYDNGFTNPLAVENMNRAVEKMNVRHIVCKPDDDVLKRIYKNIFMLSGDVCGICGIAMRTRMYKVAKDYGIPVVLLGTSPLEEDSFLPDTTNDMVRFKYIMREAGCLSSKEINDFLIYPGLNFVKLSLAKRIGSFPKEVCPFFYLKNPSDKEMGEIIVKELDWKEDTNREYSKHFDCLIEPFTNYARYHIYGYERRICQYSTMVRRGEITREKAAELYRSDCVMDKPANYQTILNTLGMDEKELDRSLKVKPLKYEKHISKMNKLAIMFMKFHKKTFRI